MNITFIQEFINLPTEEMKYKLSTYTDDDISLIAEAYFTGKDGEYNKEYIYSSYEGANKVRNKLQEVAPNTLIAMIKRYLDSLK